MTFAAGQELEPKDQRIIGWNPNKDKLYTNVEVAFQDANKWVTEQLGRGVLFLFSLSDPISSFLPNDDRSRFAGLHLVREQGEKRIYESSSRMIVGITPYRNNDGVVVGHSFKISDGTLPADPGMNIKIRYDESATGTFEREYQIKGSWDICISRMNGQQKVPASKHFAYR